MLLALGVVFRAAAGYALFVAPSFIPRPEYARPSAVVVSVHAIGTAAPRQPFDEVQGPPGSSRTAGLFLLAAGVPLALRRGIAPTRATFPRALRRGRAFMSGEEGLQLQPRDDLRPRFSRSDGETKTSSLVR